MQILNPASDELLEEVPNASPQDIRDAATAARKALPAWRGRPLGERREIMARFRQLLIDREQILAESTTRETGKPISQARGEIRGLPGRLDFFLEQVAAELQDEVVLKGSSESGSTEELIRPEALGVIANLSAWNYPYFVGGNVFIPALLTGNCVLYKPSELATRTGLGIARTLHDAGVPEDVFITLVGGGEVGAELLEQRLDGVFFTGSHPTGVAIAKQLAPRLIRLQLELGGKDPAYIADDVDPGAAGANMAEGAFYNAGQSCCGVERIYVHEAVYEPFVEALVKSTADWTPGDPLDPATTLGPMARGEAAVKELEAQVADARSKGARVLTGGERVPGPGHWFAPTVVVDVNHQMALMKDESFGPIIGVMKVKDDAEALELMQDTEFGLTASVFTQSRDRAEKILNQLDVGTAYWNCCDRVSPLTPWSGRGSSGMGCTLSRYGIEAFLKHKGLHLRNPRLTATAS